MKTLLIALTMVCLAAWTLPPAAAAAGDPKTELNALVSAVQAKLKDGKPTESSLSAELKQFDDLLASHKDEKTDDVAQILFMKAMLYAQVLDDMDKAKTSLEKLKADFPETKQGKAVDQMLASITQQEASSKVRKSLVEGSVFPDFSEQDFEGKPLSLSALRGKVVMVDFWATWCGPCVAELPNVIEAYKKYHDKGLEIVGISLDQDREKLAAFLKEKQMPWPQYFDGKGWESKLGAKYGVTSIPSTYLLDKEGKIVAKDLRGQALDTALAKALGL